MDARVEQREEVRERHAERQREEKGRGPSELEVDWTSFLSSTASHKCVQLPP